MNIGLLDGQSMVLTNLGIQHGTLYVKKTCVLSPITSVDALHALTGNMVDAFNGKFRITSGVAAELEHIVEENPWLPETEEEARNTLAEKIKTAERNPDTTWQINKIDPQDPETAWILSCKILPEEDQAWEFSCIRELLYYLDELLTDENYLGKSITLPDAYEVLNRALCSSLPMNDTAPDQADEVLVPEEQKDGDEVAEFAVLGRPMDDTPN